MLKYKAIGLMSGSSLDGLDIVYGSFVFNGGWKYEILEAETIPYPEEWVIKLREAPNYSGEKLTELDITYGQFLGNNVSDFINKYSVKPDLIGSHGHTIFHNPRKGYSLQIGNGQVISAITGITTVNDFRTGDILAGGQGAPLVPIGDELLFTDYDYCLNIGGIANISYNENGKRIAFDICPANQLLNFLSNQIGKPYDENGYLAGLGKLDIELFNKLNNHSYYDLDIPKSMSNQIVTETFIPLFRESNSSVEDKLYTVCKHIAFQVNKSLLLNGKSILITGGGAHNTFLANAIMFETNKTIIIPDKSIIDYKEALIFAFMGVLRVEGMVNCLASATGAKTNSVSGVVNI